MNLVFWHAVTERSKFSRYSKVEGVEGFLVTKSADNDDLPRWTL
jgi:hypothetical protein